MFTPIRLVHVPDKLERELNVCFKFVFGSLGVMFAGMILASVWQWMFNIRSNTLMDSPLVFRVLIIGGLGAYLISLTTTVVVLPLWHDTKLLWCKFITRRK